MHCCIGVCNARQCSTTVVQQLQYWQQTKFIYTGKFVKMVHPDFFGENDGRNPPRQVGLPPIFLTQKINDCRQQQPMMKILVTRMANHSLFFPLSSAYYHYYHYFHSLLAAPTKCTLSPKLYPSWAGLKCRSKQ